MREGFLHASWILALGMGWSISSLAEEQAPAERVHRQAMFRSHSAASAVNVENAPEKLFIKYFERVLNRRNFGPRQVVEFHRFQYNTVFESVVRENGFMYAEDNGHWMMGTQPVADTLQPVSHRKGRSGEPFRPREGRAELVCRYDDERLIADLSEKHVGLFIRAPAEYAGDYLSRSLFRTLEVFQNIPVALFCWPLSPDETTIKIFAGCWEWSFVASNQAHIRFHAEPKRFAKQETYPSFDIILDRQHDRIVGLQMVDSSRTMETTYVETARFNHLVPSRYPSLQNLGRLPSRRVIPTHADFIRAGFREVDHPELTQSPVSALRPLNMPDPHERSAWNLMWKFGLALGRWPTAGLFHYAAELAI
jgi:hypothetical protein